MPLVPYSLDRLFGLMAGVRSGRKILTMSLPDVIVPPATVALLAVKHGLGPPPGGFPLMADPRPVLAWHKVRDMSALVDTRGMFAALGWEMTSLDISEGRGGEVIHDLNDPVPVGLHGQFDLVYDVIANQVFDVACVFRSCVAALRPGGYVLHTLPVTMTNQGFWNVSPCAFKDFYDANGFGEYAAEYHEGVYASRGPVRLSEYTRQRCVPDDVIAVVSARKPSDWGDNRTPVSPVMTKFKNHPTCVGRVP